MSTSDTMQAVRSPLLVRRTDRLAVKVDLGLEPPIDSAGEEHSPGDRWRVSVRWLCGTVLTGFAGALLIGSALFTALGRQTYFAEVPQLSSPQRRDTASGEQINPGKGDRLMKSVDLVAAKQSFKAPTTLSVGDREVVRMRGFARVSTPLTLVSAGFADDVPVFNPLKLLADSRNPAAAEPVDPGPIQDEAEVSFSTRDLLGIDLPESGPALSLEEVQAQVDEMLKSALSATSASPLQLPAQLLLTRTSRVGLEPGGGLGYGNMSESVMSAPFANIRVRMVPENVTNIARARSDTRDADEKLFIVHKGETLDDILRANGAGREQIVRIVAALATRRDQPPVAEGQRLKLLFVDSTGTGQAMQIARVSVYTDDKLEATVAMADDGAFVQLARSEPAPAALRAKPSASADDDEEDDTDGMRLYNSLYETALKSEIPRPVIDDLVRIFANDVDFQRSVSAGDNFEAFYEEGEDADTRNALLFASITTRNETFRYYRFQTPDDQLVDYYDENGRSTRKFLIRKPIASGEQRSGFGMRHHPILGYSRMHTGVDWAAPIGTPIFAAGNGTVIKAGRESGYGNRVEIQHANGYITTYNHMSGFARGINEGGRVRQGQVVGYLGMTGLATGPHLHYEVIVNGHFVDPMRVKLARTRELDGRLVTMFRRERERIDGLIAKAPGVTRVAARQGAN